MPLDTVFKIIYHCDVISRSLRFFIDVKEHTTFINFRSRSSRHMQSTRYQLKCNE